MKVASTTGKSESLVEMSTAVTTTAETIETQEGMNQGENTTDATNGIRETNKQSTDSQATETGTGKT